MHSMHCARDEHSLCCRARTKRILVQIEKKAGKHIHSHTTNKMKKKRAYIGKLKCKRRKYIASFGSLYRCLSWFTSISFSFYYSFCFRLFFLHRQSGWLCLRCVCIWQQWDEGACMHLLARITKAFWSFCNV